jgi:hypothetical protein
MPYSITTKDGITINNIPDDVAPDSPDLKARVAAIRAGSGAAALEAQAQPAPSTTATGLAGAATRGWHSQQQAQPLARLWALPSQALALFLAQSQVLALPRLRGWLVIQWWV